MSPYTLRLILLTALVATCAAIVRYALGPAHLRAQQREDARGHYPQRASSE
ncbi:MAG TPA: hypothetical protein VLX44_19960 [Xanthobacteraceae bacterium]|nr:hypothetical protein [Xanthobacteraceae bacterium]